jgi:transposase InsO family protein
VTFNAGTRLERVDIDILGPLIPSESGNQYVLVIVDQFTKWLEFFLLPVPTGEQVAKCIIDGFIARFGCPLEIHTDQGCNFDGNLFQAVCDILQITKKRTRPYHPSRNG